MTHAEMNELYELYALGVLEPELADEIDQHLGEQCEYCWGHLRSAMQLTAALAETAEPISPPDWLRRRVLKSVRRGKSITRSTFAIIALATMCVVFIALSIALQLHTGTIERQLDAVLQERDHLRSAIEILSRPETRTVKFGRTEDVPHGQVIVSANRGIVFVGSQLPQLLSAQTFEMWLIPTTGAPRPAGLFRPNAAGDSVNVSSVPVDSNTKAVAVSIEPQQGSSAPTTTPILVVPLG